MEDDIISSIRKTINHWYVPLLVGLFFIGLGIWVFATPQESFVALAFLFSISFVVIGIAEVLFAISNRRESHTWGWSLVMGLANLIIGCLMLLKPQISIVTLPFYIAFAIIFRSIIAIAAAIQLKERHVKDWRNLMFIGAFGAFFGFVILWNPKLGGLSLVIWVAISLISIGLMGVYYALQLRKLQQFTHKNDSE